MTTNTGTTSNLFKTLLNSGIRPADAEELDRAFGTEPDFLDGMEIIARSLALKEPPGLLAPVGEPWKSIFGTMSSYGPTDLDTGFSDGLVQFDKTLQQAITDAVGQRMTAVLALERQKGKHKRFKSKDYLKELSHLGYSFRLNECADIIEVNGRPITDALAAKIRCQMRDSGFIYTNEIEDAYWAESLENQYHPVKDYFTRLVWDGLPHIDELSQLFVDSHGIFSTWLRKWMIGAVAKVFEAEQNPMLVLDGPQGIGKSEFVKWLAKPLPGYFVDAPINTEDKDSDVRLISTWIWEVSELGATTRKADYEALKAFLTRRQVTVRKPYGRHDIRKPAMASFVGTVNNSSGILSDPTGSRRFLICHLETIDWVYAKMDINQVWAEAYAAYLGHENWHLTSAERIKATEINELYEIDDVIEGVIKKFYKIDPSNFAWWVPTADILKVLEDPYQGGVKGNTKSNSMALAATMTRLGLQKKKQANNHGQRVWGYAGIASLP